MSDVVPANPWVPEPAEQAQPAARDAGEVQRAVWGLAAGVKPRQVAESMPAPAPGLWVMGATGGVGTTTLANLLGAGDAGRWFPTGDGVSVLVVARYTRVSLEAAQQVGIQWATGQLEAHLVGLVIMAATPTKPAKTVRDLAKLASGAYPKTWLIPFITDWANCLPHTSNPTRQTSKLRADLQDEGVLR